jgi:glycine oxidase
MNAIGMRSTDAVIVGGGVIGNAIAYFLRKANIDGVVLEQSEIGGQASSAAAGLLAPLGPISGSGPYADLLLSSFRQFSSLVPELEAESGRQVSYVQSGALRVVRNARRVDHLKQRMEVWRSSGLQMEWLDGAEARRYEPALTSDVCAAVYAPEESQINAAQLVQAFAQAAQRLGAHVYSHADVSEFLYENSTVVGVRTSCGTTFACKHVVLAAGAWSAQLCSQLNVQLPVRPIHGQMISMQQPVTPLRHIIFGDATYIFPRENQVLVGATKEEVGFEISVTEKGISRLHTTALRLVPTLAASTIERSWAGLRPGTPDRYPIFGPLPGWSNVVLATGHNSIGILLSPLSGQCIAQYIVTGQLPQIVQPFTLERFVSPIIGI